MATKQNRGFFTVQTEPPLAPPSTAVPFRDASLKKSESGLTTYNITVPRKRSRDSSVTEPAGLLPVPQKNKLSPQPSVLDQELLFHLQNQQSEIDRFIAQHTEKVRMELQQQRVRQSRMLVTAINEAVAKKLKEKDEEIQRVGKLNWVLQERAKSLCMENQILREMAQTNEATANNLRNNLEQLLAHVSEDPRCHLPAAAADQSCESSNNHVEEEDEVNGGNGNGKGSQNDGFSGNRLCRLCGVRESIVLLLPCRHLCLCTTCGSTVHDCPVCYSGINASVHVNYS
ncbi:hypothetical protein VNO78_11995 [Psophocarpus tetragonolobus]|uniref:RING-type domain-containing protein n=1 Tax=Psophocarpus tetragonolobus TaxID=3891 RepID=A0AAN9SMA4_PSOTE